MENEHKQEVEHLVINKVNILPNNIKDLIKDTGFEVWEHNPHFFIKVDTADKRYRISASFKFLNKTWGLKINIIRDLTKIKPNNILLSSEFNNDLEFSLEAIKNLKQYSIFFDEIQGINDVFIQRIFDPINNTVIFIVTRTHKDDQNTTVIFFSKDFWEINRYLKKIQNYLKD